MGTGRGGTRNGRGAQQALLAVGALLILVHTIDDSVAASVVDPAPTLISVLALAVAAAYRVLPRWAVVVAALFVGVTRVIGGVLHIVSLVDGGGTEAGDYTGIFELAGALCFLAVALQLLRPGTVQRQPG